MNTKRRRVSEDSAPEVKTPTSIKRRRGVNNNAERILDQLRQCQELIDSMKGIKNEGRPITDHFMRNPSKRADPEYYKEIRNPIDFARIQQKLRNDDYTQVKDFFADVELLIDNALSYYTIEDEEFRDASEIQRVLNERRNSIELGEPILKTNGVKKELPSPSPSASNRSASPSVASSVGGGKGSTATSSEPIDEAIVEDILTTILEYSDEAKRLISPPFRLLQSMEEFPAYYDKIKMPIDLKTIAEKTRAGCYTSMNALEADIKLLCKNAKVFNEPGSLIHQDANTILKVFNKKKSESGKMISNKRLEHCREVVDSLIAQSSTEDDDTFSEDSEEDDELADSSEWGWKLYFAVRNEQTTSGDSERSALSDPFLELPLKRYYPDYYDEIKSPMSLFMINKKLKAGKYATLEELVQDFVLVFANAMEYNLDGSEIYEAARTLKGIVLKKAKELKPSFDVPKFASFRPPTSDSTSNEVSVVKPTTSTSTPKGGGKRVIKIKQEPIDDDFMSDNSETPPPHKKYRARKMRPISTGFTPLPESKPGRKSLDELMLRYRLKLQHFWQLVTDYKENDYWPAGAFMDLPDKKEWASYYKVIHEPISLNVIKERIENNHYESSTDLMADFHLLFQNAKKYNKNGSEVYRDAVKLDKMLVEAHSTNKEAPYESPLILKDKMGWIKTKMPMYSSKSKLANGLSPVTPYDEDSNSGSGIRSPNPKDSSTPSTPSYRPKINIKERMETLPEEGRKMYELLFYLREYKDETDRKIAQAFLKLPSKIELPSYYEVIKKPLDFARIQQKLTCKYYHSPMDLINELQLMFVNACKYNEPESQIYKDACLMQCLLREKKKELFSKDVCGMPFSVQMEIKTLLTTIFVSVFNKRNEEGTCYSDSLADLPDLMSARKIPEAEYPFTFDQIKKNIDKGRYRRLDRFQSDLFHLFGMARRVAHRDSTLWEDTVQLQYEFIRARDETCTNVLQSEAFKVTQKDVEEIIDNERKKKAAEEAELERKEDAENEPNQINGTSQDADIKSVTVNDIEFSVGDYALVSPSEKDTKDPHLMRIERMWMGDGGETLVKGRWYFRPHETYHLATKKFADNEVFLTNFRDSVTSDRLMTKAAIVQPKQWSKYTVKGFLPEHIFVCEERYLGKQLHFKKIKAWPFPSDEETFEWEERDKPLTLIRSPRQLKKESMMNGRRGGIEEKDDDEHSQDSQSSQESAEEDDRCRNMLILDVDRPEVRIGGDEPDADGRSYYQQMTDKNGRSFFIGNFVLVFNPDRAYCDVMRIDKLWREQDGSEFFSGGWFARPADVTGTEATIFFQREVIAVIQSDRTHRCDQIQSKCHVLTLKQFVKERPSEIPECDIFLCESRVVGNVDDASTSSGAGSYPSDCSIFATSFELENVGKPLHYDSVAKSAKFKSYCVSREVHEEELFIFRQPMNAEKEVSPISASKMGAMEDLDMDETVSEPDPSIESTEAKELVSWLSHQPKLNSKSKSGYILFSAEIRKRIMHENPEAGFGEVSKIVGVEWKKLTEDQKKQYEVRAEYIATERAKQEATNVSQVKQIQPGQVRVYLCKWHNCDFQFDSSEGLNEHVIHYHTSQIIVDSENQYVCMWVTCVRNRKDGKPFPSLPRLHRHIKEKHISQSSKIMYGNQRSKNFFKYVLCGGENGNPQTSQLVHYPFGLHISQVSGAGPQAMAALSAGVPPQQPPQHMMNGHHPMQNGDGPHTPRVNGIDPRYNQTPGAHVQHHQMPHGHNYAAPMPQGVPVTPGHPHMQQQHGHMIHGGQPGMMGPPHGTPHPGQQMSQQGPIADARTVITVNRNASTIAEPVFVAPPSSVQARRVLHSETYLRYIESLSNGRQRSVSQYDRTLRANPKNTAVHPNRPLPSNWIRESRGGEPVKEDDVVRALWRLREELIQSTVAVERDYAGVL